jgi:glycosyltransferase involved in cell wall biosynthesis
MSLLSVIVPCYNEEENVYCFYEELMKNQPFFTERGLDVEVLYIDDGSGDNTAARVKELREKDRSVRLVSFSRNFGKEAAIYAGLQKSRGDYVVMMDADLQDPPSLLPQMFAYLDEGYDSVATRRVSRKGEPPIRSFFARMFYRLMHKISQTDIVDGARDYRLMKRPVVDAILEMSEYNRFSKGIFGWVGFQTKWVEYENVERVHGETKWSFWKLFLYSIEGITAFSTAPLAFAAFSGLVFCILAFIAIIFIIVRTLIWGDPVGEYLAKTYMEVKRRPIYLVKEESEND